ncbi:MAG: glycine--tRNA ligase, partial [Nanoarchaeota archaeon]
MKNNKDNKNKKEEFSIEQMATFCKSKGFVYPNSEIYGGFSGFFDYGPLGIELKNNIKSSWWTSFVRSREDIVGIDGSIISHPKVWKASGHVDCFSDKMIFCEKNKNQFRADQIIEEVLHIPTDGMSDDELLNKIKENKNEFKEAGYELVEELSDFNLMFK